MDEELYILYSRSKFFLIVNSCIRENADNIDRIRENEMYSTFRGNPSFKAVAWEEVGDSGVCIWHDEV
jgi:hypothetical protein